MLNPFIERSYNLKSCTNSHLFTEVEVNSGGCLLSRKVVIDAIFSTCVAGVSVAMRSTGCRGSAGGCALFAPLARTVSPGGTNS